LDVELFVMHVQFTHPDFAEVFASQVKSVREYIKKHPILSQKEDILLALNHQDLQTLPKHVDSLIDLLSFELELWEGVRIDIHKTKYSHVPNHHLHDSSPDLHEDEASFVKHHFSMVNRYFPARFERLYTYAISPAQDYKQHAFDYLQFQLAVDALRQLSFLKEHLKKQHYLAKKIQTKCRSHAHSLYEDVQALKESHDGQIGILSRLPVFELPRVKHGVV
jgi:hypothetical protein